MAKPASSHGPKQVDAESHPEPEADDALSLEQIYDIEFEKPGALTISHTFTVDGLD